MQMEGVKKAARNAIRVNNHALSSALKKSPTYFQPILEKFAAQKPGIISEEEKDSYLDTYSGQSLQFRAGQLVASLQATVGVKPSTLDDILCILHQNGAIVVQEAAKKIAKDYGLKLPKYDCLRSQKKTSRPIPAGNTETRVTNEVANNTIATDDSSGAEEPDSPPVSDPGEERQLNSDTTAPNGESNGRLIEEADNPPLFSNVGCNCKKIIICLGVAVRNNYKNILKCLGALVLMIISITWEYVTYGTLHSSVASITFICEYCVLKSAVSLIFFPGMRLYYLGEFSSYEGMSMLAIIFLALIYDFSFENKLKDLMAHVVSLLPALSAIKQWWYDDSQKPNES